MAEYEEDLYCAAYDGNVVEVEKYLARGTSVNCKPYSNNQTPLHVTKDIEVALILIQNGADVNSRDSNVSMCYVDQTPLHAAKDIEVAEILIYNGADVNSRERNVSIYFVGDTPLHLAVKHGECATVEDLICRGADIAASNNKNQTSLHMATDNMDIETAQILIQNGADVNSRDEHVSKYNVNKLTM
ncbi:unnamed protein product [Mytilus edulis]|uniref:Ankyrin repeat protein n=1 Tax=Mytilus edulis TaxID=6550 RepID=A0A8S3VAI1_MYTED|nr:unnamed protein product [Mytilus edulis]